MPIRPEMRARYPKDWKRRSAFVRLVRSRGRCEWCGVENGALGYRVEGLWHYLPEAIARASIDPVKPGDLVECGNGTTVKIVKIVLTAAHVHDQRPEACSLLNLAALCQACHNRHDAKMRQANRQARRRAESGNAELFA